MGAAVSTGLEWADSKDAPKDDTNSQLKTSAANQDSLYDILGMIEQVCQNYPTEAKAEFKKPIQWTSSLSLANFSSHATSSTWVVKEGTKYLDLTQESQGVRFLSGNEAR